MDPLPDAPDPLEQRTQAIGRDLFHRLRSTTPLRDQALSLVMRRPGLKTSLFRLVDVLPALNTPAQINRHLKEYLTEASPAYLPLADEIPEQGPLVYLIARMATWATRRLARAFIAADGLDQAPSAVARLRRRHLDFTIDLLGEAVVSEAEADLYAARYRDLIERLGSGTPGANVSIKLSGLFSQFDAIDPDRSAVAVSARLRPLLHLARRHGASVCFDMEQFAFKGLTLRIFKDILLEPDLRDWPDAAIAIQAYLPSSGEDLSDLADWAKARGTSVGIRLVKGAYWDFETILCAQNNWPSPVYTQKPQTDASFERLAAFLIERAGVLRPAIASHNVRDIARALALAERFNVPPAQLEFQMLYGMADPLKKAIVDLGYKVRVYAPVGSLLPGMAYLVRRLLENTANQSFLRSALLEHVPQEELLMNPVTLVKPAPKSAIRPDEFSNEPPTDFSRPAACQSMQRALAAFRPSEASLVIGGGRITTEAWIEAVNPSHKKQSPGRSSQAGISHAHEAIAAAKSAFPAWRDQPVRVRANLLLRLADELRRRRFDLAALQTMECGKPWREADADVAEAIDFCVYYARQAERVMQPRSTDLPGETNTQFYQPRGVAVLIAPWNFPLAILCGMTTAALVTGNTVVMKPAEQSSLVAAALMDAFEQAGFPPGSVNYLPGLGEEVGRELTLSPDVALIAFTGSRAVGLAIHEAAARTPPGQTHVKRVITEMGGKNAIIIDADADIDQAIQGVTASAFGYAGQKCSACSRLIILSEIYEAFLARLVEATRSLRVAPAEDPGCFVGPVIDAQAHARILRTIEQAKSTAPLAFAGEVGNLGDEGFYIAPHIFRDVPPAAPLAQEEIFGPVLACLPARDIDHALAIANGVPYALTGGVYSRSPATIHRCASEFRVGDLYVNRKITGALVGRQPFGGFKLSGGGAQAGGPDYLPQFLLSRVVTENTLRHGFAPEQVE